MFLDQATRGYHVSYIHNPKHFQSNSFDISETERPGHIVLVGRVKRHVRKRFRIVAILKIKRYDQRRTYR